MHRSTVRLLALFVLALLGAPVVMHVVMHDLHHHHEEMSAATVTSAGHGDHEHPIVSSPAPQIPSLARTELPIAATAATTAATWTRITTAEQNVLAFGALRTDTDVGLQPLLSVFLI
ncbi:MAG TPA: hypothetical protein VGQ36_22635 [Thermoanaerobaculia bacterium]|jgi:hypothetical protein|nr:hypothetical protein [Thermoanaerobaculia bacterium]